MYLETESDENYECPLLQTYKPLILAYAPGAKDELLGSMTFYSYRGHP